MFRNLDWPAPGMIARSGRLVHYPCAEAIAKCGKDSALSLLDYLAKLPDGELSEKQVVLGALVVLVAYGRQNHDEAVEAVKIRMVKATEGQEANFRRLLAATKSGLQANLERLSELSKK